jgi:hypothetical protein
MATGTVRVTGLTETLRAFALVGGQVQDEIKEGLVKAALPVATDARGRITRYPGAVTETILPIATRKGAIVRQRQGKRSGKRADFGSLQMRHLMGALDDNQAEVMRRAELALDFLTREAGF